MPEDHEPVSALRNLGPRCEGVLVEAGIATVGDLRRVGPVEAYHRAKFVAPRLVNKNLFYALHAALEDIPMFKLSLAQKEKWRRVAGLED